MWINIDKGSQKAQKSQTIAVGPLDPNQGNYQDPKPRCTKGTSLNIKFYHPTSLDPSKEFFWVLGDGWWSIVT